MEEQKQMMFLTEEEEPLEPPQDNEEDEDDDMGVDEAIGKAGDGPKRAVHRWTPEEHALLEKLVEEYGTERMWTKIAGFIPGRTGKQCRERWLNHMRPEIKKGAWSEEEEFTIGKMHADLGAKWSRIARSLVNRTENAVKNHWNALMRSKNLEIKKGSVLATYVALIRGGKADGKQTFNQAVSMAKQYLTEHPDAPTTSQGYGASGSQKESAVRRASEGGEGPGPGPSRKARPQPPKKARESAAAAAAAQDAAASAAAAAAVAAAGGGGGGFRGARSASLGDDLMAALEAQMGGVLSPGGPDGGGGGGGQDGYSSGLLLPQLLDEPSGGARSQATGLTGAGPSGNMNNMSNQNSGPLSGPGSSFSIPLVPPVTSVPPAVTTAMGPVAAVPLPGVGLAAPKPAAAAAVSGRSGGSGSAGGGAAMQASAARGAPHGAMAKERAPSQGLGASRANSGLSGSPPPGASGLGQAGPNGGTAGGTVGGSYMRQGMVVPGSHASAAHGQARGMGAGQGQGAGAAGGGAGGMAHVGSISRNMSDTSTLASQEMGSSLAMHGSSSQGLHGSMGNLMLPQDMGVVTMEGSMEPGTRPDMYMMLEGLTLANQSGSSLIPGLGAGGAGQQQLQGQQHVSGPLRQLSGGGMQGFAMGPPSSSTGMGSRATSGPSDPQEGGPGPMHPFAAAAAGAWAGGPSAAGAMQEGELGVVTLGMSDRVPTPTSPMSPPPPDLPWSAALQPGGPFSNMALQGLRSGGLGGLSGGGGGLAAGAGGSGQVKVNLGPAEAACALMGGPLPMRSNSSAASAAQQQQAAMQAAQRQLQQQIQAVRAVQAQQQGHGQGQGLPGVQELLGGHSPNPGSLWGHEGDVDDAELLSILLERSGGMRPSEPPAGAGGGGMTGGGMAGDGGGGRMSPGSGLVSLGSPRVEGLISAEPFLVADEMAGGVEGSDLSIGNRDISFGLRGVEMSELSLRMPSNLSLRAPSNSNLPLRAPSNSNLSLRGPSASNLPTRGPSNSNLAAHLQQLAAGTKALAPRENTTTANNNNDSNNNGNNNNSNGPSMTDLEISAMDAAGAAPIAGTWGSEPIPERGRAVITTSVGGTNTATDAGAKRPSSGINLNQPKQSNPQQVPLSSPSSAPVEFDLAAALAASSNSWAHKSLTEPRPAADGPSVTLAPPVGAPASRWGSASGLGAAAAGGGGSGPGGPSPFPSPFVHAAGAIWEAPEGEALAQAEEANQSAESAKARLGMRMLQQQQQQQPMRGAGGAAHGMRSEGSLGLHAMLHLNPRSSPSPPHSGTIQGPGSNPGSGLYHKTWKSLDAFPPALAGAAAGGSAGGAPGGAQEAAMTTERALALRNQHILAQMRASTGSTGAKRSSSQNWGDDYGPHSGHLGKKGPSNRSSIAGESFDGAGGNSGVDGDRSPNSPYTALLHVGSNPGRRSRNTSEPGFMVAVGSSHGAPMYAGPDGSGFGSAGAAVPQGAASARGGAMGGSTSSTPRQKGRRSSATGMLRSRTGLSRDFGSSGRSGPLAQAMAQMGPVSTPEIHSNPSGFDSQSGTPPDSLVFQGHGGAGGAGAGGGVPAAGAVAQAAAAMGQQASLTLLGAPMDSLLQDHAASMAKFMEEHGIKVEPKQDQAPGIGGASMQGALHQYQQGLQQQQQPYLQMSASDGVAQGPKQAHLPFASLLGVNSAPADVMLSGQQQQAQKRQQQPQQGLGISPFHEMIEEELAQLPQINQRRHQRQTLQGLGAAGGGLGEGGMGGLGAGMGSMGGLAHGPGSSMHQGTHGAAVEQHGLLMASAAGGLGHGGSSSGSYLGPGMVLGGLPMSSSRLPTTAAAAPPVASPWALAAVIGEQQQQHGPGSFHAGPGLMGTGHGGKGGAELPPPTGPPAGLMLRLSGPGMGDTPGPDQAREMSPQGFVDQNASYLDELMLPRDSSITLPDPGEMDITLT